MKTNELIEILKGFHPDTNIISVNGEEIVHVTEFDRDVIISHSQPNSTCKKCNCYVYPDALLDYDYFCPSCKVCKEDAEISPI